MVMVHCVNLDNTQCLRVAQLSLEVGLCYLSVNIMLCSKFYILHPMAFLNQRLTSYGDSHLFTM